MKIGAVKNNYSGNYAKYNYAAFSGNKKTENKIEKDPENPIKKSLEQLDVFKATLIAGLGFGARALYYLFDDTSILECTFDAGQKLAEKNYKNVKGNGKKLALGIASSAAILVGVVGILAGLYAIYNAPKSLYQGKINAHKKSEEMDVYLKGNRLEKDLYTQVGQSAKEAQTVEDKKHVQEQYMKLRAAKNQVPAFVNI